MADPAKTVEYGPWHDGWVFDIHGKKVKTAPLSRELKLAFFFWKEDLWSGHYDSWMAHINALARISSDRTFEFTNTAGGPEAQHPWKDTRIRILFEHLGILDSKFNIVLTFNSLLLITLNVLVNIVFNVIHNAVSAVSEWKVIAFGVVGVLFGVLWVITTILCFYSLRRLVWGDLCDVSEEEHVKQLIMTVAQRTNKFRLAIPFTVINISLLVLALILFLMIASAGVKTLNAVPYLD